MVALLTVTYFLIAQTSPINLSYALEDTVKSTYRIVGNKSGKPVTGTGFLVERPGLIGRPPRTILVTAAHVLDAIGDNSAKLVLRVKDKEGLAVRKELPLTIRADARLYYRKHSQLDIAAIAISPPAGHFMSSFPLDNILDGSPQSKRLVRLGREVWVASFPIGAEGNSLGHPILRRGTLASMPSVLHKDDKPGHFIPASFLLDITNFGGDSGSPVVLVENGKPLVCGLTIAKMLELSPEEVPANKREVQGSLGISVCLQSEFIRDLIELVD